MPYNYKIIVEGYGAKTGQTSLVRQLTDDEFKENRDVNFVPFTLDKAVHIWDLPEKANSKRICRKSAKLCLYSIDLSKDLTDEDLDSIASRLNEIKSDAPLNNIILVGTKADLATNKNKKELNIRLQEKLGPIHYLTTSKEKGISELEELIQKHLNDDFNYLIHKFREDADFLLTGHKLKNLDAAIEKLKEETKRGRFNDAFPEFFSRACEITDNNTSLLSNVICAAFIVCLSALVAALGFAIGCALCSWAAPIAFAGLIGFSILELNILAGTTFALISGTTVGMALGFTFFHNPNEILYKSLTQMKTITENQLEKPAEQNQESLCKQ